MLALYDKSSIRRFITGVDINASDNSGFTAIHFAARYGHFEVMLQLLNANADPTLFAIISFLGDFGSFSI